MTLKPAPRRSELVETAKRNLTVHNIGIIVLLLFQAGQYWEKQQSNSASFEVRLQAAERVATFNADTFARKDVIEERLKSIERDLAYLVRQSKGR